MSDSGESGSASASCPTTPRDAVMFVEYLATLTRGGMPLPSGLRALAVEAPTRGLRRTLTETADYLDAGVPLDEATRARSNRFPLYLRGIIAAGIRAGMLADLLGQFVRHRTAAMETRRKFWLAMLYPLLLLGSVACLVVFVMAVIVKQFEAVMQDFGIDLPGVTRIVYAVTNFVLDYGPTILINGLIATVLFLLAYRFLLGPADRRRLLLHLPLLGDVLRYSCLGEFCHVLACLVETSVPLPEAIELAADASGDPVLIGDGIKMRDAIRSGLSFSAALERWTDCPAGLSETLAWAEKHRNLADSLHLAGDMYEARCRGQAGFAITLTAALALILVLWILGLTIIAVYLPMIQLISRLSG